MADFPPSAPTTLTATIPSYLYKEYSDDDNLQALVDAYNAITQEYVTWFVQIGLPVYTGALIAGALLDWVAAGLYGITRPTLPSGRNKDVGPFNTYPLNTIAFNGRRVIGPQNFAATSDDVFKRIITWHFFKGDGKQFSIAWLKRRIMRFLLGVNGTNPPIDNTYQISVTFGVGNQVNIRILNGLRTVTGGAIFNRFAFNTVPFNGLRSTLEQFAPLADAAILKEAIDSGACEMPFMFTYVVTV